MRSNQVKIENCCPSFHASHSDSSINDICQECTPCYIQTHRTCVRCGRSQHYSGSSSWPKVCVVRHGMDLSPEYHTSSLSPFPPSPPKGWSDTGHTFTDNQRTETTRRPPLYRNAWSKRSTTRKHVLTASSTDTIG